MNKFIREVIHPTLTFGIRATCEAADRAIQRLNLVDDANPKAFPLGIISSFDIMAEMARPGSVWQA